MVQKFGAPVIPFRPKVPIEEELIDLPALNLFWIKSDVARVVGVQHRRGAVEQLQKPHLPFSSDAVAVCVVQTVFLASVLRVVWEVVGLGYFDLIRVPVLLGGLHMNLDRASFHLEIGREHQRGVYWIHQ